MLKPVFIELEPPNEPVLRPEKLGAAPKAGGAPKDGLAPKLGFEPNTGELPKLGVEPKADGVPAIKGWGEFVIFKLLKYSD